MSQLTATPAVSLGTVDDSAAPSKAARWAGRVMSGLAALFLLMDAVMKFAKPEPVLKGTMELGFSESVIVPLGVVLLVSTLLYVFPRTAVLGAILLTGYLGGSIAIHLRAGSPLFSHVLFGAYIGLALWAGLLARDAQARTQLFGRIGG